MNVEEWKKETANRSSRILGHYFAEACPCRFPRFVYWVTKDHRKGTDPVQNNLILVCRYYRAENLVAAVDMADSEAGGWDCPICGSKWLDLCEEKSKLTYAHRLVLRQDMRRDVLVRQDVPPAVLTTSDFDSIEAWERFMTGHSPWPNNVLQPTREGARG